MVNPEDATGSKTNASASSTPPANTSELVKYVMQDKVSALLYFTRFLTLIFTFLFIVPISGYDPNAIYQKAMLSCAATSALKLHQRVSGIPFQLSRAYFGSLIIEDSFHYLLYALTFMNNYPITVALMPIFGFALLHIASYTKTLLTLAAVQQTSFIKKGIDAVCAKDKDLMKFVAINEILMCPAIIIMICTGKCGIYVPFIYYRFLCMRYQSRRNPYNRLVFYEMRISLEHYTSQPSCPLFVRNMTQKLIALIARIAPPQAA